MASRICEACDGWFPLALPPDDRDLGKWPVRMPFHRFRGTKAICPGAGRVVPVVAERKP